jgi:DNA polymerase-3 subunit epsilon
VRDAEIIIHNAPFDLGFLDAELERLGRPKFGEHVSRITDTLVQAKELYPGKRNSLDALCERYGISNAHRTLHGALLDSELLAEVYLAMTRGQDALTMDLQVDGAGGPEGAGVAIAEILVLPPTDAELAEHEALLQALDKEAKGACVWRTLAEPSES